MSTISTLLPDLVDAYIAARARRLALDKEVAELKEQETLLNDTIIAKCREQGLTAIGGQNGFVKLKETQEPQADDWMAIYAYIKENDAFELLNKRLTVAAVKERWEVGEAIPGVSSHPKFKLTVSTKP